MRGYLLLLVGLTACAVGSPRGFEEDQAPPSADPGGLGSPLDRATRATSCQKMDIVFMIDNSGSMKEEQQSLAESFPQFLSIIDAFRTARGDALDYRIAVTTTGRDLHYRVTGTPVTEFGDNGAFHQACGMGRRWLERGDETLASSFACLANVGTSGPSIEMPLRALRMALEDRVRDGTNAGFLRDDALLSIVVLTDEDDCSRGDDYFDVRNQLCDLSSGALDSLEVEKQFFDDLKGPGRWAFGVMAGPGPGMCTTQYGVAQEAVRLRAFVDESGTNATFSSICDRDISLGLKQVLAKFQDACQKFPVIR
jgi:hypothetical protein